MSISEFVYPLLILIGVDLIFLVCVLLLISFLATTKRAAYAVLRRNFLAYFSNPTGYVFLCLFVLLTSMAAFWPDEFFNANLANLDQLNFWYPIIMLFFIPAITMSIWADEKRLGTDELLLTLPADDFDIVIGKFLSAVSIYTASLMFSQIATFIVLVNLSLGDLDIGLFCANYFGYWFVGLAMLSLGMVASFLTSNLTVGFILGALFNAPLAFASRAEVILPRDWLVFANGFSLSAQLDNFGRGVVSIAPIAFLLLVTIAGLYYCMVLVGRRHWSGGKNGNTMFLHFVGRCAALLVAVFGFGFFFRHNDRPRYDVTLGKVSSVSETTKEVLSQLKSEKPIVIEAFISNNIPEQFSKTRYDLVTLLKEFQSLSGGKSRLQIQLYNNLEPSGEEAQRARKQYGIEPQMVRTEQRGTFRDEEVLMGAAVRSGLSKVVIPFFESGIPVEYELVRSINTVAQPKRAKLGILATDANFMGGFSMAGGGFSRIEKQPIVTELEKQYDVEGVDANDPIAPGKYDVLLAVQPSSLNPTQLDNFVAAVKSGIPAAIFEDPMPVTFSVPGTGMPKQAPGGMFGGGQPQPKGVIQNLWNALGLKIPVDSNIQGQISPDIVWQRFNPHFEIANLSQATDEWLFIREDREEGIDYLSEASPATAGLRELMFLFAGAVGIDSNRQDLIFTPVATTRPQSGTIGFEKVRNQLQDADANPSQMQVLRGIEKGEQVIAAYIESKEPVAGSEANPETAKPDEEKKSEDTASKGRKLRVFYVADMDCLAGYFYESRRRPEDLQIRLPVQNVTFFLNIIDCLVGETNYPKIRSHEPQHVALRLFELQTQAFKKTESEDKKKFQEEFNEELKKAQEENQRIVAKYQEKIDKLKSEGSTTVDKRNEMIRQVQEFQIANASLERKLGIRKEKLESELQEKIKESQREAELKSNRERNWYKYLSVLLPPIPPLLVGVAVFVSRRVREREGISKNRLR
jgi:ABC-2 type transport system permease protein